MYDSPEVDERYTDQARIQVTVQGDDWLAPPGEEWFVTIDTGERIDRAHLRDALLESLDPPNYRLSEQHNVVHWGAAGASYDLFLTVAEGAGGTLIASAILAFVQRISKRGNASPITEADAENAARSRLCRRYEVGYNDLAVVSMDMDFEKNRATVVVKDPDDTTYEVEVYRHNDNITVARIRRTAEGK